MMRKKKQVQILLKLSDQHWTDISTKKLTRLLKNKDYLLENIREKLTSPSKILPALLSILANHLQDPKVKVIND